jgi:uncharacterized protein with FMN-binding domain
LLKTLLGKIPRPVRRGTPERTPRMRLEHVVLFSLIFLLLGCHSNNVEQEKDDDTHNGIEQVKKMEISYVDPSSVPDGEYTGEFPFMGRYRYQVRVRVKSGRIDDIEVLENGTNNDYAKKGLGVIPRMIEQQCPKVDTITGATVTSKALMKCVERALKKAASAGQ